MHHRDANSGEEATAATVSSVGSAQPRRSDDPVLDRGTALGRYLVLGLLGTGGMGVVYEAYDPELDRKVALKVLRSAFWDEAGNLRMLREAQAMAKLSHPNVVAVYDVGTLGDQVFLAMELVEGPTLRKWLDERERGWREVVEAFAQAGAGLAAAHEAGLIHRDFKPANALVNTRGRVQVTDFGVARRANDGNAAEGEDVAILAATPDHSPQPLDSSVTEIGAAVGTPRYMAPEQRGSATSARADQFAFCVSLFEALYGQHPFAAGTHSGKLEIDLRRKPSPPRSKVPRRVERAVLRGLSYRPEDRYPSMDALLAEIGRALARRRGAVALAAALAVAVGSAVAAGALSSSPPSLCTGADDELAGAWDPALRQAGARAFAASEASYAAEAWQRVERGLDDYAGAWRDMYRSACEATHVRGTQSSALLDARMACLRQRREELAALSALFAKADGAVVERASDGVQGLSPLASCADVAALSSRVPLPTGDAQRAELEQIESLLAESKARNVAGDHAGSVELAERVVARAEALGYAPLEARGLVWLGNLQRGFAPKDAETSLHRALQAAVAGRDDRAMVRAWNQLIYVVGYRLSRVEEGERWAAYAEAGLGLLDERDALEIELLRLRGMLHAVGGNAKAALPLYERALEQASRVYGPESYEAGLIHTYRGVAYGLGLHDYERALAEHEREIAIYTKARGAGHPSLAMPHNNMGMTLMNLERYEESREHFEAAREIWSRVYGDGDVRLSLALLGLGRISAAQGDHEQAIASFERARALRAATDGPDHFEIAGPESEIGRSLIELGRPREAIAHFERALALWEGAFGPTHSALPGYLSTLAGAERLAGAPARARRYLERAAAIAREHDDQDTLAAIERELGR